MNETQMEIYNKGLEGLTRGQERDQEALYSLILILSLLTRA